MKMKMLQGFAFFVMIALVPAIAIAQSASGISAKVEKVDESANKVTLDHAAIPGLDMPAMTMVYKVQDPKILKSVEAQTRPLPAKPAGQWDTCATTRSTSKRRSWLA
jgi:Cu/Ag efflux protein CusF